MTPLITYEGLRQAGYRAFQALWLVRADGLLANAEAQAGDLLTITWEQDQDYEVGTCGIEEYDAEERAKFASGEWEAWFCSVTLFRPCPSCGHREEDKYASLGGIVLTEDRQGDLYRRSTECELAIEAGLIANPRVWKGQP